MLLVSVLTCVYKGEPNNASPGGYSGCVEAYVAIDGDWNDEHCDEERATVCKLRCE